MIHEGYIDILVFLYDFQIIYTDCKSHNIPSVLQQNKNIYFKVMPILYNLADSQILTFYSLKRVHESLTHTTKVRCVLVPKC